MRERVRVRCLLDTNHPVAAAAVDQLGAGPERHVARSGLLGGELLQRGVDEHPRPAGHAAVLADRQRQAVQCRA